MDYQLKAIAMRNLALASLSALALTACATAPVGAQAPVVEQNGTAVHAGSAQDELKAYPAASSGQKRHVLFLPAQTNEEDLKVELLVGKTQLVDCNHHALGGQLETRTVQGWGYDYYVLPALGAGVSTLMGCPPNSNREAFVTIRQENLLRYNSRLPVVVYTPEDVEVRYRLWRAGEVRGLD